MKKIAHDKWRHFFVGIAMGIVLQAASWLLLSGHPAIATFLAFITVVIISYGFELFSKFSGRGHYDFYDAVASVIGGVLGMMIMLVFQLRVNS